MMIQQNINLLKAEMTNNLTKPKVIDSVVIASISANQMQTKVTYLNKEIKLSKVLDHYLEWIHTWQHQLSSQI